MILPLLAFAAVQAAPTAPPIEHPPHVIAGGAGAMADGPMRQMMMDYRACIDTNVAATPATVTAEVGAASVIAACKPQHDALYAQMSTMVASMPADRQEAMKARMAERDAGMAARIADHIRAARAGTAPAR